MGLPKLRFGRKLLFISAGMLLVLGGSGAAAIYVGVIDPVSTKPENSAIGGTCDTVETLVLKTPARRLWLRKTIRMEHADGPERIRTALRVAGLLAKSNTVDLVQVSVLDAAGPTTRAAMRGRAIGAEVVIAMQPKYLPGMKEPFIARYYEGMPAGDGIYYGERVSLELPDIQKLMAAMKSVPDKQDCTELARPEEKPSEHEGKPPGDHIVSTEGEQPAAHDAAPADPEHKAEAGHETPAKPEPSFLDGVLGMVGLGGSAEKPATAHEAKADSSTPEQGHETPAKPEASFFDGVLGMVGLGAAPEQSATDHVAPDETPKVEAEHAKPHDVEASAEHPAAAESHATEPLQEKKPALDHAMEAETSHDTASPEH